MIEQTSLFMISCNRGFYKTYENEMKSLIIINILQVDLTYAKHLLMHSNMVLQYDKLYYKLIVNSKHHNITIWVWRHMEKHALLGGDLGFNFQTLVQGMQWKTINGWFWLTMLIGVSFSK